LGEFIFLIYVPLKTGRGKREERWKGEGEGGKEEREREGGGERVIYMHFYFTSPLKGNELTFSIYDLVKRSSM